MAWNGIPVVDGDGHVMEDWDSLLQYMPEPYIKSGRFRGRIGRREEIGGVARRWRRRQGR